MKKILSLIMVMAMLGTAAVSLVSCDVEDVEGLLDIIGDINIDELDSDVVPPDVLESIRDHELETDISHELETSPDGSFDNGSPDKPYIGPNGNWWIGDTDTGIKADPNMGEDETDVETETETEIEDKPGVYPLPEFDLDGKVVTTLAWEECIYNEFCPELGQSTIDTAVFKQQKVTEERLNIKLQYDLVRGSPSNINEYLQEADAYVCSGESCDAFASYSLVAPCLMMRGYTKDLNSLEYIDLDEPYWANGLTEQCSVYGKLYFATGDISPSYFANTYVTLHDPSMVSGGALKKLNVSSVSELVLNGEWTIEAMQILSKDAASDLNADGVFGAEDSYGVVMNISGVDALAQGADISVLDHNDSGALIVNDNLLSGKSVDFIDSLLSMLSSFDATDVNLFRDVWTNGNAMFYVDYLYAANKSSAERSEDFIVLPLPKYDVDQAEYVCAVGFGYTMWSVPVTSSDVNATAAVLECLAAEGYNQNMSDVVYENFLGQQLPEADSADYQSLKLIRDSVRLDAGRVFCLVLNNTPLTVFRSSIRQGVNTYATDYDEIEKSLPIMLDEVNTSVKNVE